jgi:hypothetical protein
VRSSTTSVQDPGQEQKRTEVWLVPYALEIVLVIF